MLSNQIIEYSELHPEAKAKEIAQAVGTSPAYVYQTLSPKKKKSVKKMKPVEPTEGQKTVRNEINRLNKEVDGWKNLFLDNLETLNQLEQDVIGYRAVISYLQAQIDGIAV
jgi:DNA-directed RNA polymerase specialized sigma subunit